jgi:hypothetical protein
MRIIMQQTTATSLLRSQLQFAHRWLEETMQGITQELAQWQPQGKAHPIGSQYIHILTGEDYLLNGIIKGAAPLMMTSHAGNAGFSEPPPAGNRDDWAKRVTVDLETARAYAAAVYAATGAYLASITDDELNRPLDLTALGFGTETVSFVFNLILLNVYCHTGEVSCIKGLNGLQGYPG